MSTIDTKAFPWALVYRDAYYVFEIRGLFKTRGEVEAVCSLLRKAHRHGEDEELTIFTTEEAVKRLKTPRPNVTITMTHGEAVMVRKKLGGMGGPLDGVRKALNEQLKREYLEEGTSPVGTDGGAC